MKQIGYKIKNTILYFKRKEKALEPHFHFFGETPRKEICVDFLRDAKTNKIVAVMDLDERELYMVPPGKNTHNIYKPVLEEFKVKYIDGHPGFEIAVPVDWYIEWANRYELFDRKKEAIAFKKQCYESFYKVCGQKKN